MGSPIEKAAKLLPKMGPTSNINHEVKHFELTTHGLGNAKSFSDVLQMVGKSFRIAQHFSSTPVKTDEDDIRGNVSTVLDQQGLENILDWARSKGYQVRDVLADMQKNEEFWGKAPLSLKNMWGKGFWTIKTPDGREYRIGGWTEIVTGKP